MNMVFRQYLNMFLIVFIDDVFIYLRSENEHTNHLRIVLQALEDQKLSTKFIKCEFWLRSIAFLGHIISSVGLEADPRNYKAIKNWPRPLAPTDTRSFLGLAC